MVKGKNDKIQKKYFELKAKSRQQRASHIKITNTGANNISHTSEDNKEERIIYYLPNYSISISGEINFHDYLPNKTILKDQSGKPWRLDSLIEEDLSC